MKLIICALVVGFIGQIGIWGNTIKDEMLKRPEFSLASILGIHFGMADEIVYDLSGLPDRNNIPYLSNLKWDIKPAFTLGLEFEMRYGRNSRLNLEIAGVDAGQMVGEMNNYDWFYTNKDWSHWSRHRASLRWAFMATAVHHWKVYQSEVFSIHLGLGYHTDLWAWDSSLEYSIYSSLSSKLEYPREHSEGQAFRDLEDVVSANNGKINYDVIYHVPLLALLVGLELPPLFLRLSIRVGPVFGSGRDEHVSSTDSGDESIVFRDSAIGGPWVSAVLDAGMRLNQHFSFVIGSQYAFVPEMRGNLEEWKGNQKRDIMNGAALVFERFSISMKFVWNFGV